MYEGPSVTIEEEQGRQQKGMDHARSSAWSVLRIERVTILSFADEGNVAEIQLEDGTQVSQVRVKTPLEFILFMYGEPESLKNVYGSLTYRNSPDEGWVEIGDIRFQKEDDTSRNSYQPFYF